MDFTPKDAFDYLSRLQHQIDSGGNPVQDMMTGYRNAALNGGDQSRRRFIDVAPDHTVFYRKMSLAEWNNGKQGTKFDFSAPFAYTNTNNYRLWMSTSLDKVRVFDNANASSSNDVVVKFVFDRALVDVFTVKAHQESGVQGNANVVAMHREGFPSLVIGMTTVPNLSSDVHVGAVKTQNKAYNLGFTSTQADRLNAYLVRAEVL